MRFSSFDGLLAHQARRLGDRPALCFAGSGNPCSWRDFDSRVREGAEFWKAGGKTCLGLFCDGSFDCVVNLFAANLAGLQVVLLDENAPDEQLPGLLAYTDADALWGDEDLCAELAPALTGGVRNGRGRLLFFTSGTTDSSKAVVLTDESLCASAFRKRQAALSSAAEPCVRLRLWSALGSAGRRLRGAESAPADVHGFFGIPAHRGEPGSGPAGLSAAGEGLQPGAQNRADRRGRLPRGPAAGGPAGRTADQRGLRSDRDELRRGPLCGGQSRRDDRLPRRPDHDCGGRRS